MPAPKRCIGAPLEDPRRRSFLTAYAATGDWSEAARRVRVPRATAHGWNRCDVAFRQEALAAGRLWRGTDGLKRCRKCGADKPVEDFRFRSDRQSYRASCAACRATAQRERYAAHRSTAWFKWKASRTRSRAASLHVSFDLDPAYLESIWTGRCPISGVELVRDGGRSNERAAELDRIDPAAGYVRGNVAFISRRMNRMKNDITLAEARKLLAWLEEVAGD